MEKLLAGVGAVTGVNGSFVVSAEGRVLVSSLPSDHDEQRVYEAGSILQRTIEGLQIANAGKSVELNLRYSGQWIIVKSLGQGCLIVLCDPEINLALFNLTVDVVVRRFTGKRSSDSPH